MEVKANENTNKPITNSPVDEIIEGVTEQPNTAEETARAGGWKPQDEWEGDPAEWRSAEVFNERGVWMGKLKEQRARVDQMEQSFNTRLEGVNKLHKVQLDAQKADLEKRRDDAIDLADREAANGYQDQIDTLNSQPVEAAPVDPGQGNLDAWNAANPWIFGNDPKAAYAKQQFGSYQSSGMSADQALAAMETDVNRAFPEINPSRDKHPSSEGGSRPGGKRSAPKLTMADLTREEMGIWKTVGSSWGSQAEFLQAVQDDRSQS